MQNVCKEDDIHQLGRIFPIILFHTFVTTKYFSYAIAAFHSAKKRIFAVEKGPSLLFGSLPKKEEFFRHQKRKCLKIA